jgi:Tol biopolymer transport system component
MRVRPERRREMNRRIFSSAKGVSTAGIMLLVASVALTITLAGCAAQKAGTGPTTKPASNTHNGRIAFSRLDNRNGQSDLFVIKADGTGEKRLTTNPVDDSPNLGPAPNSNPAHSPNSERLAFEAETQGGNTEFNIDIYVMNADSSGLARITQEPTFDSMPSWSPDGTRLVYSRMDISWMFSSAYASASAASARNDSNENGIYTIRADGSGLRKLTGEAHDENPAWSPDGKAIAFGRLTKHAGWIYTVNSDGGGLKKLTDPPKGFWDSDPSWSPDGTKLAFTRASARRADVFTMNADGTHTKKLTGETDGFSPAYSPDGKKVAFVSNDGQTTHIHVMNADGTNVRRLTTKTKVNDDAPDWQTLP